MGSPRSGNLKRRRHRAEQFEPVDNGMRPTFAGQ